MALTNQAGFPQVIQTWVQGFTNADGANQKAIVTAGANGSIIESLNVTTTDVANSVNVWINNLTTTFLLGRVPTVANQGSSGTTAALDVLRYGYISGLPVDANGNFVIYLKATWILQISFTTTLTAATNGYVVAMGSDY